jgi:hypothetical protein
MTMADRTVRLALERHWDASDASDFRVEHEIYREDAVLDCPQSGERIRGRRNIQESRFVQPNRKRFTVRRIFGYLPEFGKMLPMVRRGGETGLFVH